MFLHPLKTGVEVKCNDRQSSVPMNLDRIRSRIESDPFYRMKLRERFEFHMSRYYADLNAGRWPQRHHSRSSFFLGMALDEKWDALVQWQPPLNTPNARSWEEYRQ